MLGYVIFIVASRSLANTFVQAFARHVSDSSGSCLSRRVLPIVGCIECMRYGLLLPMILFVCLSTGFTWLRCIKTAERIEVLFGWKTTGAKEHCVGQGPRPLMARGRGAQTMQPLPDYFVVGFGATWRL